MMNQKITVSVLFLVIILLSTKIFSQNSNGRGMGRMQNFPTFTSYDLDSNGVITETEFKKAQEARQAARAKTGGMKRNMKNAPTFKSIDTNHDGKISKEEFATHQANYQNRRYNRKQN